MLSIMRADVNDLDEIFVLQRLSFYSVGLRYNDPLTPPLDQTLDELIEESEGQVFLKAVCDGNIVGAIRGRLMDGDVCRVSKVMVHPDHQNKGIGRKLMNAIEKEFDVNVFELRTGYLDAITISLYKKLGYVLTGDKERITETLWFVRMRKEIPK
jgi:GNAT superfamily N-acetyltransferase